jgi:hypothetical protein
MIDITLPDLHSDSFEVAPLRDLKRMAWFESRRGKFTASQFYRLATVDKKPNELPAGAKTYVMELVAEKLTMLSDDNYTTQSMQHGIDNELPAIAEFETRYGIQVEATGENQQFVELDDLPVGATCDGLAVGVDATVEVKCLDSKNHIQALLISTPDELKQFEVKFYFQILGQMLVTGRKQAWIIFYDPRFIDDSQKLKAILIDAETVKNDVAFLKSRLEMAADLLRSELAKFQPN